MKNKITVKRLLIYLAFSFLLVWIPTLLFMAKGGEYDSSEMQLILSCSMLCPSMGMLLTRWLTKEGFPLAGNTSIQPRSSEDSMGLAGSNSMGLGIVFRDKKWIWYVAAVLIPILYNELGTGLLFLLFPESFDMGMLSEYNLPLNAVWLYPIATITSTCMLSIGALGEEAGWRGYMMPKLEELFGLKKAVLIGGIIWGIWHFPANMAGHNFGTGYWGEPWSGFVSFTLYTISIGTILTYITKKSGSVWPAAFLHAVNNGGGSILSLFFNKEKLTGIAADTWVNSFIHAIPMLLMGVVFFVLLCRDEKREKMELMAQTK